MAYTKKIANKLARGRRRTRSGRRGPRGAGRSEAENGADPEGPRPKPRGTRRGGTAGPRRGTGGRREAGDVGPRGAKRRADRGTLPPGERERDRREAFRLPGEGPPEAWKG